MDQTRTGFGLSGRQQRNFGWALAVIIGCLSLFGGIGFNIAVHSQSIRWLVPSLSLMLCFLIVTAICLALLDIHPVKRVLLFGFLPTFIFAILTYLAGTIARSGPDLGGPERIGIDMAFLCMSIGSLFWFYRIHRGWRLTRRKTRSSQNR